MRLSWIALAQLVTSSAAIVVQLILLCGLLQIPSPKLYWFVVGVVVVQSGLFAACWVVARDLFQERLARVRKEFDERLAKDKHALKKEQEEKQRIQKELEGKTELLQQAHRQRQAQMAWPPAEEPANERLRVLKSELNAEQRRLRSLRLKLLNGGLQLPPRIGLVPRPGHLVVQDFFNLRNQEFLGLAQYLQAQCSTFSPVGWQMLLTEYIFEEHLPVVLESLLLRPFPAAGLSDSDAAQWLDDHCRRAVLALMERITQKGGRVLDPGVDSLLWRVTEQALKVTWDVLTATPPGWLILPVRGERYDPGLHQVIPGDEGNPRITAVIFPGYVQRRSSGGVVEKAQVYTNDRTPLQGSPAERAVSQLPRTG